MKVAALGYIGFESPHAKAWEDFGPAVLGMAVAPHGADGSVRLRMDDHEHRLAVHPGERDRLAYLGWELPSRTVWEQAREELGRAGLDVEGATDEQRADRAVRDLFTVTDPAGFRHEIHYGPFLDPGTFVAGRALSGFVTGTQGMGHAVLIVPDLDAEDRFVRDTLGFAVSDELPGQPPLIFYHANPRHHSLALAAMPGMRGIQHLMLEVASLDDVGTALDLCHERDVELVTGLGRHTNDHMVSFYLRTPSGFDIEYGWGADAVDPGSWRVGTYRKPSIWGHRINAFSPASAIEQVPA